MKKIYLILLVFISLPAFSARYLVQLGTVGSISWANPVASGGTVVDLTVAGKTLNAWFNDVTLVTAVGDEVWVAGGTYTQDGAITVRNGVSIYGSFAGTETAVAGRSKVAGGKPWAFTNQTTLDGGGGNFGGIAGGTLTDVTTIDGLEIKGFNKVRIATGNGNAVGIQANTIMQNCIVAYNIYTNNFTDAVYGIGVYVRSTGKLLDSWIHHNEGVTGTKEVGGPVLAGGLVTVKGCLIENNKSTIGGGGIHVFSNAAANSAGGTFEDLIIRNNETLTNGGGMYYYASTDPATPRETIIKNCQFLDNKSAISGGGLYINFGNFGTISMTIEGCSFIGNISNSGGTTGAGAGLYIVNQANPILNPIKNCIFKNNVNTGALEGAAFHISKSVTVQNFIIANNSGASAGYFAGANSKVYNSTFANNSAIALKFNAANNEVVNTVFWFNGTNTISGTLATVSNNAYDAGADAGAGTISSLTATNTFALPTTFVGSPANETQKTASLAAKWWLKTGSPAIDAGTTLAAVTNDITGLSRPVGSAYDMGAYEFDPGANVGIREKNLTKVLAYPSVTDGIIKIESENIKSIRLYDLTGKVVGEWAPVNQIDIAANRPGIYILQLKNFNGDVLNYKIVRK